MPYCMWLENASTTDIVPSSWWTTKTGRPSVRNTGATSPRGAPRPGPRPTPSLLVPRSGSLLRPRSGRRPARRGRPRRRTRQTRRRPPRPGSAAPARAAQAADPRRSGPRGPGGSPGRSFSSSVRQRSVIVGLLVAEHFAKATSSPEQMDPDRRGGHPEESPDLRAREPLEVVQEHGRALVGRQDREGSDRVLDLTGVEARNAVPASPVVAASPAGAPGSRCETPSDRSTGSAPGSGRHARPPGRRPRRRHPPSRRGVFRRTRRSLATAPGRTRDIGLDMCPASSLGRARPFLPQSAL